jgi:D-3-phosphoglycerate dehydrogenase
MERERFRVLVTDNVEQEGIDILKKDGNIDVDIKPGIKSDELTSIIGEYDAVVTRSGTDIKAGVLERPGRLKIIGRAGVGLDNVDIEAASKKGIIVMNAPTGNTLAATELTMGVILSAARKIPLANNSLKSGSWDRKQFMGMELYNKTLGIVGLGRIGTNVAIRAKSFGMRVIAYDPFIKKSKADDLGVSLYEEFDKVLGESDVITFHTPLTNKTRNMVTAAEINKMKDGIIIINCARGGIVNENDLYEALKSGKVFTAGVDVFETEPPFKSKLLEVDNLFVTPHIGANTWEGQKAVSVILCEQMVNALNGRPYQNAVNIPFIKSQLPDRAQLYFDLAERMGKLAAQIVKGRTEEVRVLMVGKGFEEDLCEKKFDVPFSFQPFTVAALKGFLEVSHQETVTFLNAPYLAQDRNITVQETKTEQFEKFNDLLVLIVSTDKGEMMLGGTVFSDNRGRVILLDGFRLDIILDGTFLNFRIFDRPGVIGRVGTILGDHNINIAGLSLSRQVTGEEIAFVSVDSRIEPAVMNKILAIDGMIEANVIEL